MANVLLVTHGTGGDVIPFIKLGKILKNVGYDVSIFTHCIYEMEAKKNGLNFVAIDSYREYQEKNERLYQLSDPINKLDEYLEFNKRYCGADMIYKEYMLISEYYKGDNTIILFRHRFSLSGLLIAEKYRCCGVSVFLAPNYIQHLDLHEQLIGEAMRHEINSVRSRIGLSNISSWTDWMCAPKLKIAVWPKWYASDETENIKGMTAIGFLAEDTEDTEEHYEVSEEVEKFINSGNKTVLITAGTSKVINPEFYKIAIQSCNKENINAILVTPFDEFVPKNLTSNILRLYKAPIKEVMRYVDAVIHHGGIGTASEAIACGIPQVIMPHISDGPDNADRLRKFGVAKVLPMKNWNVESLAKILSDLLNEDILSSCKALADKMAMDDPKEILCSTLGNLLENKDKYQISYSQEINLNTNNYITSQNANDNITESKGGRSTCNNESSLESISEKKKRMLVELMMKKRKE